MGCHSSGDCWLGASGLALELSAYPRGAGQLSTGTLSGGYGPGLWYPRACPSARRHTSVQPAPVSAQLANSRTFAKLPRAGEPRRSGRHHRGPRGGSGLHPDPAAPGRTRKSCEKAGVCTTRSSADDLQEDVRERAARLGLRRRGRRDASPAAATRWPSPAPRLASGGSAAE